MCPQDTTRRQIARQIRWSPLSVSGGPSGGMRLAGSQDRAQNHGDAMNAEWFSTGFAEQLADAWDQGPHVFRNVLSAPLFSPREFIEAIVATAAEYFADPNRRAGRVYVAGEPLKPEQLAPFLPTSLDQSVEDYLAGLTRTHPDFAVILAGCERHIPAIRERFLPLLHAVFSRVGYPMRTNSCIYAGTYRTTPFGIHMDFCHVLLSCGIGTKTLAFWPQSYFESRKDLFVDGKLRARVDEHLQDATVITLGPRDALYWPGNHWHVAINDKGTFEASLSMGVYHRGSSAEAFQSLQFLPRTVASPALSEMEQYDALDLVGHGGLKSRGVITQDELLASPLASFLEHWNRVRTALNQPGAGEMHALSLVLSSLSSAGFGKPSVRAPETPRVPLGAARLQCTMPEALIVSRRPDGLAVGANGQVFLHADHTTAIERLIAELRSGPPRGFEDLLAATGGERSAMESTLQDLVDAGAVVASL
jgi:hypothetical protein